MPFADLRTQTLTGLRLSVPDRGAWGSLSEVFITRIYEPFFARLEDVRGWVDLGCNNGFFSFGLLDHLACAISQPLRTRALLGDASETCVRLAREAIRVNQLADCWDCQHVVVGPPGAMVTFTQCKDSVHSTILPRRHGQRTFRYATTDLHALWHRQQGVFDLVKIDIEGAERFLFKHYTALLGQFRFGLCEWHAPEFDGAAMRGWLHQTGWETVEMRSQTAGWDPCRGHSWESPLGMVLWHNASPMKAA